MRMVFFCKGFTVFFLHIVNDRPTDGRVVMFLFLFGVYEYLELMTVCTRWCGWWYSHWRAFYIFRVRIPFGAAAFSHAFFCDLVDTTKSMVCRYGTWNDVSSRAGVYRWIVGVQVHIVSLLGVRRYVAAMRWLIRGTWGWKVEQREELRS